MRDSRELIEVKEDFTNFIDILTANDYKHHSNIKEIIKYYGNNIECDTAIKDYITAQEELVKDIVNYAINELFNSKNFIENF